MDAFSSSFVCSSLSPNLQTINIPSLNFPAVSRVTICKNLETIKNEKAPPPTQATDQQPKKSNPPLLSLRGAVFDALDTLINTSIDPPDRHRGTSFDPNCILSNNYVPVDELPPTECPAVEGALPACLDGVYIRNGPNPQFFPRSPYHSLEGDGMLHSIRISKGKATFCSRYVKTYKYITERNAGFPIIPNFFSILSGGIAAGAARWAVAAARILTGQFSILKGMGSANISVALIGGKLYALGEGDLPYEIKLEPNGDIITLRRHDFGDRFNTTMTPHAKIDPETKEAFAFRLGYVFPPFLTFFRINPDGNKGPDVPIFSMKTSSCTHDLAITSRYAIFPDIQIGVNVLKAITGGRPTLGLDPRKIPRIGVLPRHGEDGREMRWFDVPGVNFLHMINAWEEGEGGDTVVMVAPNVWPIEHFIGRMDLVHASIEKLKIDLKTGIVWRRQISSWNLEFAVINPAYVGKKTKYVYAAIAVTDLVPVISGVAKLDISLSQDDDHHECVVASRLYGPSWIGGEPFFVAREPDNPNADEDDGYVICFVHDENKGVSSFLVMDAKSPNLEIVAVVKLPRRVPSGIHGLFIRENDLP
ncbi:OLC1v1035815C1 [Oldenlandia corymbosa var. corymbosa]|uniref:OLC1v1035815C1 n=1 Tax=Oldenlandia corymbosa var. corymbosa TaxID=529605 RepID=A0AAV1CWE0_OLDCO|nr:OLC1v1035815C1 [Oldenlandia corymbosa var. corymbosa]